MDSGIYQLTFNNGDTYVGKSLQLTARWRQHCDKLSRGTAAKNMMQAYYASEHEYPTAQVLLYCHPDVLDEYENYYIHMMLPTLNTQRPTPRTLTERQALQRHAQAGLAHHSFPSLILALESLSEQLASANDQIEELETIVEDWDNKATLELAKNEKYLMLVGACDSLRTECKNLEKFKQRVEYAGWFSRLFKLW